MRSRVRATCDRRGGTPQAARGPTGILPCRSRTPPCLYNRGSTSQRRRRAAVPHARRPIRPRYRARRARRARCMLAPARAAADRARAARRRRFDLGGVRTRPGHRLGRSAVARGSRASAIRIASSTRASPATRPPGARARCRRCSRSYKPAIVVLELGGNDGLRGGDLRSTQRQPRRDGRGVQQAGAKPLIVGMKLPPNYGAGVRRANSTRCSARSRRRTSAPLVPFFFEGFGESQRVVPARPHPSDRGRAAAARSTTCGRSCRRSSRSRDERRRPPGAAARDGPPRDSRAITVDDARRLSGAHRRPHARPNSPKITFPAPRASPVLDDAERARIGTMHAQESAFAAQARGRGDRRAQHRRDARRSRSRQAARLVAARLLLARRPAQPLA